MVSVIMPVYNGGKYIGSAIDSVLNQTFQDFEFIIVNDGSTDNTESIVKSYNDKRIKYYYQNNSGYGRAKNFGMSVAKGEFISFIDHDDIYMPNKLKEQVKILSNNKSYGLVYCDVEIINAEGKHISYIKDELGYTKKEDIHAYMLFRQITPAPTSIMINAECYKKGYSYSGEFFFADDYKFLLNLSEEFEFYYLPLVLYKYRKHNLNMSSKIKENEQQEKDIINRYSNEDISRKVNKSSFSNLEKGLLIAKIFIKIGRYNKAVDILESLKERYNSELVGFYLGNCYYIENRYIDSIKCYTEAINVDINMAESYNNRGCAYASIDEYDKAKMDFNKAKSIRDNYMDANYNVESMDKGINNYKITMRELRKTLMVYNT